MCNIAERMSQNTESVPSTESIKEGESVVFVDVKEDRLAKGSKGFYDSVKFYGDVVCERKVFLTSTMEVGDVLHAIAVPLDTENTVKLDAMECMRYQGKPINDMLAAKGLMWEPFMLIERKDRFDLASSITAKPDKPGVVHFPDQKNRMRNFCAATGCRPALLVESYFENAVEASPIGKFPEDSFHSAVLNTVVEDGFVVLYTTNIHDSSRTVLKIAKHLEKKQWGADGWTRVGTGEKQALDAVGIRKKDLWTPQTWYRYAVWAVPGMGKHSSNDVCTKYPTMTALLNAYRQQSTPAAARKMLAGVELSKAKPTKTGKQPKLGKVLSERIYEFIGAEHVDDGLFSEDDLFSSEEEAVVVPSKKKQKKMVPLNLADEQA